MQVTTGSGIPPTGGLLFLGGLQREVDVGMGHCVLVLVAGLVVVVVDVAGLVEVAGLPVLTGKQGTVITVVVGAPGPGTEGGLWFQKSFLEQMPPGLPEPLQ